MRSGAVGHGHDQRRSSDRVPPTVWDALVERLGERVQIRQVSDAARRRIAASVMVVIEGGDGCGVARGAGNR
jgi:hypothetical protein